ncbi:TlpA family protein disulfide reductase [Methylobacterium sp. E-016]|uniref:TlpA family protein disulfide reductase n=1 Tax=Methylobacterium sp. E-016 TaxID=2836556 RepID=UPI001FB9900D|nr:TlpA disulfide reductase family protein [Methylobacterium sp. E-016]MCJ2074995.1 TlpA family protein disulfide reductase [Methylobacterium sp. E-016]
MSNTELLVGDVAPKLQLGPFLKGEPVEAAVPGTVAVVEFWSPTCGPCVASIPHLTALQAAHPEVVVLGIALGPSERVKDFVHGQGEAMAYRVALDAPRADGEAGGSSYQAWCEASFRKGIPASFIVDRGGRIAWIGHPMELDEPLAAVLEGRWDLAAKAEAYRDMIVRTKTREAARLQAEIMRHARAGDRAAMLRTYDEHFAADPELERVEGNAKLRLMFWEGRPDILDYARHLIAASPGDDKAHFQVGSMLCRSVQGDLEAKKPVDPSIAAFAVEAMLQAEHAVLARSDGAGERVEALATLAQALLTAGQADAAQARARAARDLAETAGLAPEWLAGTDALLERCATAASVAAAAPTPEMVCADGVCRIGPA